MQIPFDHLSVDEHKVMKDVFKRSKLLKALPNRKKYARVTMICACNTGLNFFCYLFVFSFSKIDNTSG